MGVLASRPWGLFDCRLCPCAGAYVLAAALFVMAFSSLSTSAAIRAGCGWNAYRTALDRRSLLVFDTLAPFIGNRIQSILQRRKLAAGLASSVLARAKDQYDRSCHSSLAGSVAACRSAAGRHRGTGTAPSSIFNVGTIFSRQCGAFSVRMGTVWWPGCFL